MRHPKPVRKERDGGRRGNEEEKEEDNKKGEAGRGGGRQRQQKIPQREREREGKTSFCSPKTIEMNEKLLSLNKLCPSSLCSGEEQWLVFTAK